MKLEDTNNINSYSNEKVEKGPERKTNVSLNRKIFANLTVTQLNFGVRNYRTADLIDLT